MKRIFFKVGLFLALGLTAMFYSCNDDDDNGGNSGNNSGNASTITATNVTNSSAQIATVKALAYLAESGDDEDYGEIAQAPYENNGFTLELPETLADKYLVSIDSDYMTGVAISDKNAKIYLFDYIAGYDKDENIIGGFSLSAEDDDNPYYDNRFNISWMYADRDVTVKGEYKDDYEDIDKYDLKLQKGWNIVYHSYSEIYDSSTNAYIGYVDAFTSQKPAGVNYSWNFIDYSTTATSKSVENKKSVFSKLQEDRKNRARQREEK